MMYHKWLFPDNLKEAVSAQNEMALQVVQEDAFKNPPAVIAGVDISCNRFDKEKRIFAAISLFSYPSLECIGEVSEMSIQPFPYITGFLGFREAPALVKLFEKLEVKPDLIMVDGQGVSHPRGLGIATHLGLILDIPTIGVAKSILVGKGEKELGSEAGSKTFLIHKKKQIGMLLRSKKNCLPLIISSGHRISLKSAVALVSSCLTKYRLPEPTRHAHLAANACRRKYMYQ